VIVGADFAPSSLPTAQRIRFFTRHLSQFGWEPILVTTAPQFYESALDWENERLVPEGLRVIRTPAIPANVARKFGIGDLGIRSLWHHWRQVRRLCLEEHIDLVFISVPPYVSMVLGRLISIRFGTPYVIDYQDPWVTEYYWRLPRKQRPPKWPLAYALARILEPFALRRVSGMVGVSTGTTDDVMRRYPWMHAMPTAEIPLGGEPADFEYLAAHPRSHGVFTPHDGLCHVSYVGVCIPQMYPAVRAILEAVRSGLTRAPELFSRLRLHFVGSSYAPPGVRSEPKVLAMAREVGVAEFVDERTERVPYLDSLQLLLDSQALLLIGTEEPHYTASKVFPYLLAGRPVIAVFHQDSNIIDILKKSTTSRVVTFDHDCPPAAGVETISRHLEEILRSPTSGAARVRNDDLESYSTYTMTARLASLFDAVIQPSQPSEMALRQY
jgi:hypothetical protein